MPNNLLKEDVNIGRVVYQWSVKEYEEHERDKRWYWLMGAVAALLLVYSLWTANYIFTLIIALFGIILYMQSLQTPLQVNFAITEVGIVLGCKFYRYSELKSFWIIYNPPEVKNLYFSLSSLIRHRLQVPLLDNDPRPIRDFLNQFLQEDLEQEEEPLSDKLGRVFKLH
ncbi:hypothetical protein EPN28_02195 [Patescibacteria group bacterium]|nr:MAG: hypothetical protein EPN28_02195 [Patescibacteria group bacterium]